MHSGVILVVEAESKEDAYGSATSFLDKYYNEVWDWFQIGGRWTTTLAPKEKLNEFREKTVEIFKAHGYDKKKDQFLYQNVVDKSQEDLQTAWEELGLEGENAFTNHYNLSDMGGSYDIVPLESCLETVKEWAETGSTDEFSFDSTVFNVESGSGLLPESPKGYYAVMIDMHN